MANVKGEGGKPNQDPKAEKGSKRPPKGEGLSEVPKFFDETGQLLKLKSKDFPRTKEGKMAYCDYQIERWKAKRERVRIQADPRQRKLKKIEKLKGMLARLEKEMAEEDAAATAKPQG